MIITDPATNRSVSRLMANPDFRVFLQWLEDESQRATEDLLSSLNPVLVHQLQGAARTLLDIQRAAMLAPQAAAAESRASNT